MSDADETEFSTVAGWTAEILEAMPDGERVPAACQGSGNPAALAWLAEALGVGPGTRLLDAGGGIGGPAAWVAARYGARPVVCEPMRRAAGWARRLFGVASVAGEAGRLPFGDGAFECAWALGVLSTVGEKALFLDEVRRVLRPGGGFGMLEYAATTGEPSPAPEGNDFVPVGDLAGLLGAHGFTVVDDADGSGLPPAPAAWREVSARVDATLAAAHPGAGELDEADRSQRRFSELLRSGQLTVRLVHATRG